MKIFNEFVNEAATRLPRGIKELKDGLTLEIIKTKFPWILNAKIKNAVLGFGGYQGSIIYWYDGKWKLEWRNLE